ncbi:hypothetical protein CVT24_005507 [Panaeolus cyanescens]|uniref:Uncharacterized protein n=1 Tax=Panaeolus cyanescens TaxID=181874 RepID=A0A409YC25_9AGAR|nr:hypothetical protein CVT24_005507 [Panaeolus cyanescens]
MISDPILNAPIGIIGSGAAGQINAHVLLRDGFTDVTIITRDSSVGGTWARERVYPGLFINNVHGEYRFSALDMPPPSQAKENAGRLSGMDLCNYMEKFSDTFLKGKAKIMFRTTVLNVHRDAPGEWRIKIQDLDSGEVGEKRFSKIVLATGGCSNPKIPHTLSPEAAERAGYKGVVIHSCQFAAKLDTILEAVKPSTGRGEDDEDVVLVVGCGKSAQDAAVKLTIEGRKVIMVFSRSDPFLASKSALPDFIRKSRFLSIMFGYSQLNTRLERFLHQTTIGSTITRFIWKKIEESSLDAFDIPQDSPLRTTHKLFWGVRTSDEGKTRLTSFHSLAVAKSIEMIAPARVVGYLNDGESLSISTGRKIKPKAVVLATGYQSSWTDIFTPEMAGELGIRRHEPLTKVSAEWNYASLSDPPPTDPEHKTWVTSIYRGLVPAKNILHHDFAIAGALFSANFGYTNEVAAHWIASYLRGDSMVMPRSVDEAMQEAETQSAWMKTRYPDSLSWINDSYSTSLDFWTWPQAADQLLDDMRLPSLRSGGNWFNWAFKIIDLKEIENLTMERGSSPADGGHFPSSNGAYMQNLNQNLGGRTNEDPITPDRSASSRFVPSREEEERPREEEEELQSKSPRPPDGLGTSDALHSTPSLLFPHAQAMLCLSMAYQKISSMEEQLPACQNELKEARAELAVANERFAAHASRSRAEASHLHSQLHAATGQNAHLTKLKEAQEKENQSLREMLHKARNSLAELKAQHSDLAEALRALKKAHDENVPSLHELRRELEATPVELYLSPAETMSRSAKCRETNSELERALAEAQQVSDMFRNKLQIQATILAENQGIIRDLQEENRHLRQELDSKPVLEQVAAVESKMAKVAERLIKREEETIDTLANLSSVQANLEATNNQVIAYREALDNSKKARDNFKAELDARCLEVKDLAAQLKRSEEAKEDAMAMVLDLKKRLDEKDTVLGNVMSERQDVQNRVMDAISHLEANYASRMESITERERTLRQTLNDTQQKNTELEERLQAQSVALFKAKEDILLAKERLLSESAKVDVLNERLTSNLTEREIMVKALEDRYTTLEREFERVKTCLSDSERRNVDLESRVEQSQTEVRELQISQQNSATSQSREMDQRYLEAQRQIGLLVKERDELRRRSEKILQRYQTNSLSDEEKVFVEHVMQDARAIHEQDMIKKGQEIRLKEVLIQEIKAKNKELETTVARYIKELSKSSGGEDRSVVGLKPFLLGLSSPRDESSSSLLEPHSVNVPGPKPKLFKVEGNSRSSSLSSISTGGGHDRSSGKKRIRSPTPFSEPPSKPKKRSAKDVSPTPAGNTASKKMKMSASATGHNASSSRLPHSASPPDLAAIAAVAPKKKPAGRKRK